MKNICLRNTLGFTFLSLAQISTCNAEVLLQHLGANDPVSELPKPWVFVVGPNSGSLDVGPVINDVGGFDAWKTNDDQTTTSGGGYRASLTPDEALRASTSNWLLRARLRVVDFDDSPAGAVKLDYSDSQITWRLAFGSTGSGDPIVSLGDGITNPSHTITGAGSTYNLYELAYDPLSQTADLFVNGTLVITGYTGLFDPVPPQVNFGSGSTGDTGQGNWNLIELIVPTDIDSIIEYVQDAISYGDIYGRGPGRSADGRLNAFLNKLMALKDFIEQDLTEDACGQLDDIIKRSDGIEPPLDFVVGPGLPALADMLAALRDDLACS